MNGVTLRGSMQLKEMKLNTDRTDEQLIDSALQGDRSALEQLILRHEKFVYNLAVRMLWNRDDAADAAQEIFLRMVTHLSSFKRESKFKTWLYRVACNHLLQWNRQSRAEQGIQSFACYASCLAAIPDTSETGPEKRALVNEAGIGCMLGMLLCLSREQRIVFVLGEIFELPDTVCAAVLDITNDNFRQKLRRSRTQLYQFMQRNCGLVNPQNTCRCNRKLKSFIDAGIVDERRLQFADAAFSSAHAIATLHHSEFTALISNGLGGLYRQHPAWQGPSMVNALRQLISDKRFSEILMLNEPAEATQVRRVQ